VQQTLIDAGVDEAKPSSFIHPWAITIAGLHLMHMQSECSKHTLHTEVRAGRAAKNAPLCCGSSLYHPGGGYFKTASVCGPPYFQRPAGWDLL